MIILAQPQSPLSNTRNFINYKDETLLKILKFFCRKNFCILRNMEKISQENAIDTVEPIGPNETTIDINNLSSETKDDILSRTKRHRKNINEIIVSEYGEDNYAVTYSEKDTSLLGWTIDIEQNGQQHPHVYFKLDQSYDIYWFKLCKKTLLFCYYEFTKFGNDYRKYLF